jgi:osmoprotectant transport system substrate-binding protein
MLPPQNTGCSNPSSCTVRRSGALDTRPMPAGTQKAVPMKVLRRLAVLAATTGLALSVAACGSDDRGDSNDPGNDSRGGERGKVVVGSASFTESELIARMYGYALEAAGFEVEVRANIGSREIYAKSLENDEIQVVPEYAATVTEYFNAQINGKDAAEKSPIATSDPVETVNELNDLIESKDLVATLPSDATDQNAFAVTEKFAEDNNLETMSDLSKLNGQLILGGPPECPERPFCQPGLEETYGLQFKEFKATDAGGPVTFGALKDGTINLGLVFTSDGSVEVNDLKILEDDKKLQLADNIIALHRKSLPAEAVRVIEKVNASFSTEDLQEMNKKISVDKDEPSKLAEEWVKEHQLG